MVIELPAASPILITQENTAGAVAIRDAHHYVFGGTLLGATEMVAALAAYREDLPPERQTLLLHCDRRAPLESLLLAAAAAREAGFTAVQIAIPSVQAR
jgi:biopolymer transport protein ExbD